MEPVVQHVTVVRHCVNGANAADSNGGRHCVNGTSAEDSDGGRHCVNGTNAQESNGGRQCVNGTNAVAAMVAGCFDATVPTDGRELCGRPDEEVVDKALTCNMSCKSPTDLPGHACICPIHSTHPSLAIQLIQLIVNSGTRPSINPTAFRIIIMITRLISITIITK